MATTPEENATLVCRFLTDVVAGGDTDAVEVLTTADVTSHDLVFGDRETREDMTKLGSRVLAAADVGVEIEDVVATEDKVAVRATVSGSHRESLMDLAPTGKSFDIAYVWFCHIEEGQIAEIWSLPDGLNLMVQLDAIPEIS